MPCHAMQRHGMPQHDAPLSHTVSCQQAGKCIFYLPRPYAKTAAARQRKRRLHILPADLLSKLQKGAHCASSEASTVKACAREQMQQPIHRLQKRQLCRLAVRTGVADRCAEQRAQCCVPPWVGIHCACDLRLLLPGPSRAMPQLPNPKSRSFCARREADCELEALGVEARRSSGENKHPLSCT